MKKLTKHHIQPRSRGGENNRDNILLKTKKEHEAYHTLFINALPEEAIIILLKNWFYKSARKSEKAKKILIEYLQNN